ncbi:Dda-like helicase [Pectobacterium bacteriophage PM2]|uniref:DNA helicase n=1 Tax=Pectobacterium bacteriophage PM2 TaxID=1429794 RepID=A0A0A0Q3A4_9CAUD|nr:Dda-like helicase [Pectobacterium bacteriophage PM2]AHY24977.1 DNA helicase [Pectobacterium bacteriophage PM2]
MSLVFEDLKQGQREAFNRIIEVVKKRSGGRITLNGPAGCGKTTLTKFIIDHLVRNGILGVVLAAPTHQAKKVLSKLSGVEANTIHRILKINPNTYEDQDIFEQREMPDLSKCNVLICDEASMYGDKLFGIILRSVPSWCVIIGIGDREQLPPVEPGSDGQTLISPFFTHPSFEQLYLTEVVRSNTPIIDVATEIRMGSWLRENIVDGHGVHEFNSSTALKDYMTEYFNVVKDADDLIETRMLAFTNKSVDKLNSIIRRRLYETETSFIKDEIIVMQEPMIKELEFDGKKFSETIFNNGQLVRIKDAMLTSGFLSARNVSTRQMINYWSLEVETAEDDEEYRVDVIKFLPADQVEKFNYFLAKTATTYREMKNAGKKAPWEDFWKAKRTFLKVRALPVSTIHKAQGVSVNRSFLYTPCIHIAEAQLAKQLAYVGVTRARHDVYYV